MQELVGKCMVRYAIAAENIPGSKERNIRKILQSVIGKRVNGST